MGVTFALNFNWPLIKKTMDQESMTAFGFLHIKHFFRKNSNLSSLALSDTFMGKNIRFVPCLPYVWPKFARFFVRKVNDEHLRHDIHMGVPRQ